MNCLPLFGILMWSHVVLCVLLKRLIQLCEPWNSFHQVNSYVITCELHLCLFSASFVPPYRGWAPAFPLYHLPHHWRNSWFLLFPGTQSRRCDYAIYWGVYVCVRGSVHVWLCMGRECMCECVCERDSVHVWVCMGRECMSECVCVRDSVHVWVCLGRECMSECVCVRERERTLERSHDYFRHAITESSRQCMLNHHANTTLIAWDHKLPIVT